MHVAEIRGSLRTVRRCGMETLVSAAISLTGLCGMFGLAWFITSRYDRSARSTAFAGPPTHVRVLNDDSRDPSHAAQEHMTFLADTDAA
jgi:hypothetical protein